MKTSSTLLHDKGLESGLLERGYRVNHGWDGKQDIWIVVDLDGRTMAGPCYTESAAYLSGFQLP